MGQKAGRLLPPSSRLIGGRSTELATLSTRSPSQRKSPPSMHLLSTVAMSRCTAVALCAAACRHLETGIGAGATPL